MCPAFACCRSAPTPSMPGCNSSNAPRARSTCSTTCSTTTAPVACFSRAWRMRQGVACGYALLVDDLYTTNTDPLLRGFAALPHVEVRLFNPFCCARGSGLAGRFAASLIDVRRLNHRMHNKLLVADGVMAVAGGRNIADDYFQRGTAHNFVDLDALMVGPVAGELSVLFDQYWNADVVWPIDAVAPTAAAPEERLAFFERSVASERASPSPPLPAVDALGYGPLAEDFEAGKLGLIWGQGHGTGRPAGQALSRRAPGLCRQSRVPGAHAHLERREGGDHHLALPDPRADGHRCLQGAWRQEGQDDGADQLARRDRRAARAHRLLTLPQPAARRRRGPVRAEPHAHPAQQAPGHVRLVGGPAACEDGRRRRPEVLHRLDEPGPPARARRTRNSA